MALGDGWLTVREALQLPEPDRSWMTGPLPKEHSSQTGLACINT